MFLDKINSITDLRKLKTGELEKLSEEVREYIIDVVSKNGGHLAPSLGVVELTVALHYVFNTPQDKLIWDVGHQSYAHKILTGRREEFLTIRKYGGLSGFPKVGESEFDTYNVGHSSTSLSLALGEAVSRDLKKEDNKVIAIIGDGSLTGGQAFEALNNMGHMRSDVIIILNDNEHSISENVGGLSTYLTSIITGSFYNKLRRRSMEFTKKIPRFGDSVYKYLYRYFHNFKGLLIPGKLFEDLGIRYFGPVDGHNLHELVGLFGKLKHINSGPKIVHVITKKGKGYDPAEIAPSRFHGLGPFDRATGQAINSSKMDSYSEVAGKSLAALAGKDDKIIAITAAMKEGTGLSHFEAVHPERFFDVGIAEQHAVTFASALAASGMKPFVSIYSTFLQRSIDQLIHDVGIMKLPLRVLIDRAGLVGDDGETHHGVFDIALIKNIPNFLFLAPSNGEELRDMIYFAASYNDGPVAIRFPRGRVKKEGLDMTQANKFTPGKAVQTRKGSDVALLALGDMEPVARQVHDILKAKGIGALVLNLLSIKPLDIRTIERKIKETRAFVTLENGIISGGIGEYIVSNVKPELREGFLFAAGFPDVFVTHGSLPQLFKEHGLDAESLARRVEKELRRR
ncbi:MAG: 1-deoxy-D-xylulose-5-phosphate synthase [bacterium]|nr:1-deoxy-D-xylulose-5-phosphate synthase [bacterium]